MTTPKPVALTVQGVTVKSLRETLCLAQQALVPIRFHPKHVQHLQALVDACDQLRPLSPDGVHGTGERCTPGCGCEQPEGCNLRDVDTRRDYLPAEGP